MADLQVGGSRVASEGGTCITKNCIYMAQCQICVENNIQANLYVGRATTPLSVRISGHRFGYNDINIFRDKENVTDKNCLWAHLNLAHGLKERSDFDKSFKFCVLKTADPHALPINEQQFIDKFNTLFPYGLNSINSIFHSGN